MARWRPVASIAFMNTTLVPLARYSQLKLIAWNRAEGDCVDEAEALALYERNWRYVDEGSLDDAERQFIDRLTQQYGAGVLLV